MYKKYIWGWAQQGRLKRFLKYSDWYWKSQKYLVVLVCRLSAERRWSDRTPLILNICGQSQFLQLNKNKIAHTKKLKTQKWILYNYSNMQKKNYSYKISIYNYRLNINNKNVVLISGIIILKISLMYFWQYSSNQYPPKDNLQGTSFC